MAENKRKYESETIALPPLKFVLGDVPQPDPVDTPARKRKSGQRKPLEQEEVVARLIAHLKEK